MQTVSLVPEECTDDYLVFAASEPLSPDASSATDSAEVSSTDTVADSSQEDTTTPAHFRLPLTADTRSALRQVLGRVRTTIRRLRFVTRGQRFRRRQ